MKSSPAFLRLGPGRHLTWQPLTQQQLHMGSSAVKVSHPFRKVICRAVGVAVQLPQKRHDISRSALWIRNTIGS